MNADRTDSATPVVFSWKSPASYAPAAKKQPISASAAATQSLLPTLRPRKRAQMRSRTGAVYWMTTATPTGSRWIDS